MLAEAAAATAARARARLPPHVSRRRRGGSTDTLQQRPGIVLSQRVCNLLDRQVSKSWEQRHGITHTGECIGGRDRAASRGHRGAAVSKSEQRASVSTLLRRHALDSRFSCCSPLDDAALENAIAVVSDVWLERFVAGTAPYRGSELGWHYDRRAAAAGRGWSPLRGRAPLSPRGRALARPPAVHDRGPRMVGDE